jgi:2-polyprenyl-6-methoxyphenol hydroxylase-like FAD-dependent oxidoreductase
MATMFERVVAMPVRYEMLYVGQWKMNLLLADRYGEGRVFLAGDAVHLVIPTGGLGMNTGVGDAIDLSWKLAATLQGWGGPNLLASYEIERRQVGERNVAASGFAAKGRGLRHYRPRSASRRPPARRRARSSRALPMSSSTRRAK